MPNSCLRNIKGSSVIAQQLFLGSSIVSFNNNLGWGGSSSSLTVELINDISPCSINVFNSNALSYPDNHYYNCIDDSCYIDETGQPYNSAKSKDKIVPGKVYHAIRNDNLISKYWTTSDPGFLGHATHINANGVYDPNNLYSYNIIGCPVYFRYGYFSFGGVIKSWERSNRQNTVSYTVTISSADDILQNSKVIIDHYAGAIFAKYAGSFGGPINFIDNRINYIGSLKDGNIPNVFNVYGFLESYGFGASSKNDEGMPLAYVLDALSTLTSVVNINSLGVKQAFSPFGRIIAPTALTNTTVPVVANFADGGFGIISPELSTDGNLRSLFTLDLSEIPRPPLDIRISAPDSSLSIADLIRVACEKTGRDFYTVILRKNGLNVIKVKTINRTISVTPNAVSSFVTNLENTGLSTTYTTFGKEQNQCSPKVMYIGGNQQRLYQAKSYTLAYSQTNYIYNPIIDQFVNFDRFTGKHSAIKVPNFLSTKNTVLNKMLLGSASLSELYDGNEIIRQTFTGDNFNKSDIVFSDANIGGKNVPWVGNYHSAFAFGNGVPYAPKKIITGENSDNQESPPTSGENPTDNQTSNSPNTRYVPLINHAISPFFGYKHNEQIELAATTNNIFRYIRPVFLDRWTGQLAVTMSTRELPILSLGSMASLYAVDPALPNNMPVPQQGLSENESKEEEDPVEDNQLPESDEQTQDDNKKTIKPIRNNPQKINDFAFKITETEIRAAIAGFDSYLAYCLAKYKTEKPDLFVMLVNLYKKLGKLTVLPTPGFASNSQAVGTGFTGVNDEGINYSGDAKQKTNTPNSEKRKTNINFGYTLSYEFISDLRILVDFIKNIGDKYYGKKYLVRIPGLKAYRDKVYADIQIPASSGNILVYQGSGKIFFDKELVDGAWEELGNEIDDSIIVGGPAYYRLIDDKGLIKPILGYNASFNYDDASRVWCEKSDDFKLKQLKMRNNSNLIKKDDTSVVIQNKKERRQYDQAWANRIGSSINCEKKIVPSINLSSIGQDYLLINTNDVRQDAFGRSATSSVVEKPAEENKEQDSDDEGKKQDSGNNEKIKRSIFYAPSQKLYITTTCDDICFWDPNNLIGPRVIIDSPGIELFNSSYSYTKDPNLTVIANVAIEDLAVLEKKNLLTPGLKKILMSYCIPILDNGFLVSEGDSSDQSSKHESISPKMAQPLFAGIPLKSNLFCYGPWTNYPSLNNQSVIFPGILNTQNSLEQLISDVKVERKEEFVPWQTGGASALDLLVINTITAETSYQSVLENGQISIYGPPICGLAGGLTIGLTDNDIHTFFTQNVYGFACAVLPKNYIDNYTGLILSSISTNGSVNGVSTNYNFRTYSQKLGIYSKENADRIKQFSTSRISLLKKMADMQTKFEQKIINQINKLTSNASSTRSNTSLSAFESKIYGRSPSEVFIGRAMHYIPKSHIVSQDPGASGSKLERHHTKTALYMPNEILSELSKEYDSKSVMSMDGFFSPISFYPTVFGSTYSLSSRCITNDLKKKNVICPKCGGLGFYKASIASKDTDDFENEIDYPCPLCCGSKIVYPSGESTDTDAPGEINILSLNPIVVPFGEFKNPNAQPPTSGERSRHSIAVIGRSEYAPIDFESLDITKNLQSLYDPQTGQFCVSRVPSSEYQVGLESNELMKVTDLSKTVNKDFYDIDLTYKYNTNENILLNQRFFGLRGPLMMHGWGYDTEGYPVPNAADEPLEIDNYGRPKRFILTASGTNDLTKDGAFLPTSNNLLGDIIGKGYKKDGNEWVKTKSKYFHLNWAERPDLWPVGPIDVRWDNDRRVWSASGGGCEGEILPPYIVASGNDISLLNNFVSKSNTKNKCPYKMVYITLEEDMILPNGSSESYPTRAFIDDVEYSIMPMDYGIRKLVYVKDRCGYTAPRGAKLLCRYDTSSGFYEPISKQSFIVFGNITAGNNAIISLTYIQGFKKPENAPRIPIIFDNTRFNFNINAGIQKRGMFLFENGKWILIGNN